MTIGSILLGVALLIVVVAFLARPFFRAAGQAQKRSSRLALLNKKEAILGQIKRLDFEYDTAKIPEAAYHEQRSALILEAAELLQEFEQTTYSSADDGIDAKIEAAIAQLRGDSASDQTAVDCPNCHNPTYADQKFCPNCGFQLTSIQKAPTA